MKMKKLLYCFCGVALSVAVVACGNNTSDDGQKSGMSTPAEQNQTATETPAAMPAAPAAIGGKVLETMEASGYTYVKLDDGAGNEIWAAGPKTNLEPGEEITLQGGSVMENFNSKTLDRTFEKIIFASGFIRGGTDAAADFASAAAAGGVIGASTVSGGSGGAVVPFADLHIDKAAGENAKSINEIFAQAAELDTQKISVQGQVVKISKNIMGKNWLHLQDGTGDPLSNTHDLVVTMEGEAEKGAIVTIEGVVAANKDFGSGYKYDVIIEEAVVK